MFSRKMLKQLHVQDQKEIWSLCLLRPYSCVKNFTFVSTAVLASLVKTRLVNMYTECNKKNMKNNLKSRKKCKIVYVRTVLNINLIVALEKFSVKILYCRKIQMTITHSVLFTKTPQMFLSAKKSRYTLVSCGMFTQNLINIESFHEQLWILKYYSWCTVFINFVSLLASHLINSKNPQVRT